MSRTTAEGDGEGGTWVTGLWHPQWEGGSLEVDTDMYLIVSVCGRTEKSKKKNFWTHTFKLST